MAPKLLRSFIILDHCPQVFEENTPGLWSDNVDNSCVDDHIVHQQRTTILRTNILINSHVNLLVYLRTVHVHTFIQSTLQYTHL